MTKLQKPIQLLLAIFKCLSGVFEKLKVISTDSMYHITRDTPHTEALFLHILMKMPTDTDNRVKSGDFLIFSSHLKNVASTKHFPVKEIQEIC